MRHQPDTEPRRPRRQDRTNRETNQRARLEGIVCVCGNSGEAKGNRTNTEVFDGPPPRDPSLAVPPIASGRPLSTQVVSSHDSR